MHVLPMIFFLFFYFYWSFLQANVTNAQNTLRFRKRRENKHPPVLFLQATLIDLLRRTRQSILKAIMLFHFDICSKVMVSIINNVISDHSQSIVLSVSAAYKDLILDT